MEVLSIPKEQVSAALSSTGESGAWGTQNEQKKKKNQKPHIFPLQYSC